MNEKVNQSRMGVVSITLGIFGLILYFIGFFFYSFVDNRLYGLILAFVFGILAVIFGYLAKKQNDPYGTYGIVLGLLVIIIEIITFLLTTIAYVEIGT